MTINKLRALLCDRFGRPFTVSETRTAMQELGLRYGPVKDQSKTLPNNPERRVRLCRFVREWAEALTMERSGEAIIVYTDESFVNVGHHLHSSWFDPSDPLTSGMVYSGVGAGKRLIILHAISRFGLMAARDASGQYVQTDERELGAASTCELVYEGKEDCGDYHKNMTAATFMFWLRSRLFVTFRALFPGKRMILILDNAAYHKARSESFVAPNDLKRSALISKLTELKVATVTRAPGSSHTAGSWPIDRCGARGGESSPTVADLRYALSAVVANRPDLRLLRIDELFRDESLADSKNASANFHRIVWTPPYECRCQPIELMWGYAKGYVAMQFQSNRTLSQLRAQTHVGFCGDGKNRDGVTAERCVKWIEKSKRYCNSQIPSFSHSFGVYGTVDSLSFSTGSTAPTVSVHVLDEDEDDVCVILSRPLTDTGAAAAAAATYTAPACAAAAVAAHPLAWAVAQTDNDIDVVTPDVTPIVSNSILLTPPPIPSPNVSSKALRNV